MCSTSLLCSDMIRLLSISMVWIVSVAGGHVRINTDVGDFVGTLDSNVEFDGDRRPAVRFLGIPFAKPPVGSRRFKRPEVPERHPGIYNATYFRPHCAQSVSDMPFVSHFTLDEDCLYLNIFIPGDRITDGRRFPVMIWIYGGAFRSGGADIYRGDIVSAFNDVIVVTFNYRVNVFGFLSDGSKSSGNFGLWDQKMAIEWVHRNIEAFGGDVNNVTLFGQSAGGASVIFQALHVDNKNLFHRVIAQSGSAVAPWAIQRDPSKTFWNFANRAGCRTGTSESRVECLRGKATQELLSSVDFLNAFLPSVDEDFLADEPAVLLANQSASAFQCFEEFVSRDLLIGVNSEDGAYMISAVWGKYLKQLFRVDISKGVPKIIFDSVFVPTMLERLLGITSTLVTKAVLYEYTDWTNEHDTIKVRSKMVDMSSDVLFFVPAINTANKHSDHSGYKSTYFYEFSQKPWFSTDALQLDWVDGASHSMEIPYVFGLPDSFKVVAGIPEHVQFDKPSEDVHLSMLMMKMWTNFAKSGNPNSPSLSQQGYPKWPVYESDHQPYFRFSNNITSRSIKHRLAAERVKLWTDLVPALQAKCSTNKPEEVEVTSGSCSWTGHRDKRLDILIVVYIHIVLCYLHVLFR